MSYIEDRGWAFSLLVVFIDSENFIFSRVQVFQSKYSSSLIKHEKD